jgi:hypothetical protein
MTLRLHSHPVAELGERKVVPADLVEELERDPFPFDPDRVGWMQLARLRSRLFR